ncbi:4-(cytidine 5'-diphospho)-2-C-methyl-D-erythritol kinase [Dermatophilus congolensis]|uniref:4-diphosphocytidyl-2-C-methyl-D-erythritol kinase n=1 Tax=Dermatophilus congolensis TaxID=1863 RepID=A0A239VUE2_9MICO|nr:4-(cytidine 5'-diphospho)-2-C-methyl-D-erythritol kinase [Dermatophilus congolensis]MBO3129902.1 4-(cytidine 5'-diphospho)-2-C-methyl-D-erythritol kinase [Dermatophilus congolensis]MBO3131468.1 4-(cytidine 5'-diphospho)-2-C-methyl-D-erythritol kinase [Dermatophilus congolensis]MBO3134376.1 4-(cytidine 5'-diphospho)-2-C-methyl-D-erythritol kinase [Dermatophilus congolensis]MBO3136611.1 4-(cytidine 5'-diphospho)-2-C-methyl-D-erythritol kinase [Dermatophilus congolensis]MBO3138855.1 4-(cytidin
MQPNPTPTSVTVRVPAKINLELIVGPRRDDGYHDLSTTFHAVGVFDEVTLIDADEWSVEVRGPYAQLLGDPADNLALRAAQRVAEYAEVEAACRMVIDKRIPVAAGMAGGSADAAAALIGANALWCCGLEDEALHILAAELGSDVNFALVGGTAIGSGRGENVVPVLSEGSYEWVFVVSQEGLSTPSVFGELDRIRADRQIPTPVPSEALAAALRAGDVDALAAAVHNDMEEAALSLRPDLAGVIDAGRQAGALVGFVSGSGPTVVFLARDLGHARELTHALTSAGVGDQVLRASGSVHGAHLIAGE